MPRKSPLRQASPETLRLLRSARGKVEPPIRGQVFGTARFRQHGQTLGEAHAASVRTNRSTAFFPRLRDNIAVLREAHRYIGLQELRGHPVGPAGEWLLDNFHLVVAQIKEIHDGLPLRYFRDLPVLLDQHLAGLPRIYGVAWAFVAHTDSAMDETLLVEFLTAYQTTRELTLGELWALPTTLRVVLIENLRRLSERVATAKAARALADLCCDQLAFNSLAHVQALFEQTAQRGVQVDFALQLMQRLHPDLGAAMDARGPDGRLVVAPQTSALPEGLMDGLSQALALALPDSAAALAHQQTEEVADNLSVGNSINALRLLGDIDWRGLIAQTSLLTQKMQQSASFVAERDDTQDVSLHDVERLSKRSGRSELEIADALLGLMQTSTDIRTGSPSHWLRGPGKAQLHQALGLHASLLPQWAQRRREIVLPVYLGTLGLGSLALTIWFVLHSATAQASTGVLLLAMLCAFWPVSEALVSVINRLISESVPPSSLPRLALLAGIPREQQVMVVIPAMLNKESGVQALAQSLLRHYLANRERHAQFALLTDFVDADKEHLSGDAVLLAAAVQAIDALEASYPPEAGDARRFLLLQRPRRWCETEQCWMGWERKRGKLEQLIGVLSGATARADSPFMDLGPRSQPLHRTCHVLTLDSDTGLPPGALRDLLAVASHPLNQPRVNAVRREVVAGYGILQPRITTRFPAQREATLFHALFAGQCGVDPYAAASSEVYQDLFDEGSFTGKGLLHVQTYQQVLAHRLPAGQVLSHDLIEGALARCGGVSDVTLVDDAPLHADVAASRQHRWTRGDWQLLPLLLHSRLYRINALNRWKLLDNLRRSLVAPFSVALFLISLSMTSLPFGSVLMLVAAAFGAGPLFGAIAAFSPSRDDIALRHFYGHALAELIRVVAGTAWHFAQLLQHAMLLLDASIRALHRAFVSRRHCLQWTTAEAAAEAASVDLGTLVRTHKKVPEVAGLLGLGLLLVSREPALAVALCALWAGTPLWVWWVSRMPVAQAPDLSTTDREYLLGVARETWALFELHAGANTNHLPPDNVQTVPHLIVAQRTSPTNLGLYLLSLACAQRFGWIDTEALLTRAERTLASMDLLARHNGHFLNWYSTQTLQPLAPAYVSTVDSGNLCGHLLALAGACHELQPEDNALTLRLRALSIRCRQLAEEAQFGFLFDARRRLFHIGYRVAEQQLDKSYYDLLASEARLASLWAIAKGDVPVSHWAALGRPFFGAGGDVGLRSWSGSMFEYLMPGLILHEPPGTVLASAALAAVNEQMAHAETLNLPWGMSESAYAVVDQSLAYQYAPQGVPRLALRRTPLEEIVIAPYASLLAALWQPHAAVENLRQIELLHARSELGFVDALDFTPERQHMGSNVSLVSTYMAHHQGMSLVALANVLLDDAPRRWGMADARLDAVASLLQERVPREVSRLLTPPLGLRHGERRATAGGPTQLVELGATGLQPTHLLSNGRYSVALRANGAGWSRLGGADITRWRDDGLRDAYGTFFYLRRTPSAALVSLTQHPAPDPEAQYQARFHSDRVCLEAEWSDLRTHCTVWVSPEDDIELRHVELWNDSDEPVSLTLMSMFEPVLTDARADEAHPAFSNFFIDADWDAEHRALYLSRKPRLSAETGLYAVHFIALGDPQLHEVKVQTDRARWLGRNRDVSQPLADISDFESDAHHTGLDPLASLSMRIELAPHAMAQLTLATAASTTRADLEALVDRYTQAPVVDRSSLMSATFASIQRREMRIPAEESVAIQLLTTAMALLQSRPSARPVDGTLDDKLVDRRDLWRFGISGDAPILVVSITNLYGLPMVRMLAQALRLWSAGGLAAELVILNAEPHSYLRPLQPELAALLERYTATAVVPGGMKACGFKLLQADELSASERSTLNTLARVRFNADGRPLSHHVDELSDWHDTSLDTRHEQAGADLPALAWRGHATPPTGRFDPEHGGFSFQVKGALRPVRPWVNLLANAGFGTQVSEAGAGFTWAGNSRMQQLTSWSNDPVGDASGEGVFVQDLATRAVWRVGAVGGSEMQSYDVEHRHGLSSISHRRGDLSMQANWCVDPQASLKQVRVTLRNHGGRTLRLRVISVAEWILGSQRDERSTVRTAMESMGTSASRMDVLLAMQADAHAGFGGSTAFMALHQTGRGDAALDDWSCDRRELFDARGRQVFPDQLGERCGAGLDPCAAAALTLNVAPGDTAECVLLIGHGDTPALARKLVRQTLTALTQGQAGVSAQARETAVLSHWDELLGQLSVRTPDPLFDALVNRWLLYQTLACRLWGRAGFYQAGGAFGFRDQLQDAMALALAAPDLLRDQLLLAAAHQFAEGDVQHWWHPPTGAGVRTHMSDDLLWLPYATLRYLSVRGDKEVLDKVVPFLASQPIPEGAEDAYFVPQLSDQHGTLYEHCARAIDHSLKVGAHGLPLMGTGDWNDGMNRVGNQGRGESIWLAWFLCALVRDFAPVAQARGDTQRAATWLVAGEGWRAALEGSAWDGEWYVRAFFDDGSSLGSHTNTECRIDLIAQAWSVLSGEAQPDRQHTAMASAAKLLMNDDAGLIHLLDPPLQQMRPEAGYIQAYPPGVRENGGQYSHAAVWALMAQAKLGDGDGAYRSFTKLSAAHRSADALQGPAYELEPYVMAGDVYTQPPYVGRGGWSWYTGSAAWMYRAALESICGLQVRVDRLCLRPQLPSHWPIVTLRLQLDGRRHELVLCAVWAVAEIAKTRARGALNLAEGEWLALDEAGDASCHLVVLAEATKTLSAA